MRSECVTKKGLFNLSFTLFVSRSVWSSVTTLFSFILNQLFLIFAYHIKRTLFNGPSSALDHVMLKRSCIAQWCQVLLDTTNWCSYWYGFSFAKLTWLAKKFLVKNQSFKREVCYNSSLSSRIVFGEIVRPRSLQAMILQLKQMQLSNWTIVSRRSFGQYCQLVFIVLFMVFHFLVLFFN